MWRRQVDLGCIPYYMFVARDTGAQHYFSVPLVRAWEIFRRGLRRCQRHLPDGARPQHVG